MLRISGQQTADYFKIVCEECGEATKNKFLSWGLFEASCEKCGTTGNWKRDVRMWEGLPSQPHS